MTTASQMLMRDISELPLYPGLGGLDVGCDAVGIVEGDAYIGRATVALANALVEMDYPAGLLLCDARYISHSQIAAGNAFPEAVKMLDHAIARPRDFGFDIDSARSASAQDAVRYRNQPDVIKQRGTHLVLVLDDQSIVDVGTPAGWRANGWTGRAFGPEVVFASAYSAIPSVHERRGATVNFLHHDDGTCVLMSGYHYVVTDAHRRLERSILDKLTASPEAMRPAINRIKLWLKPAVDLARAERFSPALLGESGAIGGHARPPSTTTVH